MPPYNPSSLTAWGERIPFSRGCRNNSEQTMIMAWFRHRFNIKLLHKNIKPEFFKKESKIRRAVEKAIDEVAE